MSLFVEVALDGGVNVETATTALIVEVSGAPIPGPPGPPGSDVNLPTAFERGLLLGTEWDSPFDPVWQRFIFAGDDADHGAQVYVANANQVGLELNVGPGKRASVTAYGDGTDAVLDLRAEHFTLNNAPWTPDATAAIAAHDADTTNVHGITDTAALATAAGVTAAVDALPVTRPRAHSGSWAKVLGFYFDVALPLDQESCMPILLAAGTLDRMSLYISAAGSAGARVRLGIRHDDGNGYPGAVLLDAGQINSDSAGPLTKTVSQVIPADGLYWFSATAQVAASNAFCVGNNTQPFFELMPRNEWEIDVSSFIQTGVTGPLGAFTTTRNISNRGPMVMARYA